MKPITFYRTVEKQGLPAQIYPMESNDYIEPMLEAFMKHYEQDKFMYESCCKMPKYQDKNCAAFRSGITSWSYTFIIDTVTVTGYLEGVNPKVYPQWDVFRLYDPDDDMERQVRAHDD